MARSSTSLGELLRRFRRRSGFSQEELASRAGLSSNAISALERGERKHPYPHTVRSLGDALELSTEELELVRTAASNHSQESPDSVKAPEVRETSLPSPVTPLIGRELEVGEITAALVRKEVRILTLTGTGGVGKTRLSLEAARRVYGDFGDGVVFVGLASLSDPDVVFPTVLRVLGGVSGESVGASEAVASLIGSREMLLVIDNFEHLMDVVGEVALLAERCPNLTMLITSRAPLRIRGENEYPVQPLALPPSVAVESEAEITAAPAGALFVERARSTSPAFRVDRENAALVASICWRLSGIPLALELAAARTRFLSPKALLERLDEALAQSWVRDLPDRQRTMNATLDWSYQLLEEPQRRLFESMSVFSGSISLEAIEQVAVEKGLHSTFLLGSLVEQSLVVVDNSGAGSARYRMLEPLRQYAHAKFEESPEKERVLDRHGAFYLELVEDVAPLLWTGNQSRTLDLLARENPNIEAALAHCLDSDRSEMAARFCWALWVFWWARNYHREGKRWSTMTLEQDLPPYLRARVLPVAASSMFIYGDYEIAEGYWSEGLKISTDLEDPVAMGFNTLGSGLAAMAGGNFDAAGERFARGLGFLEESNDDSLVPLAHAWLGTTLLVRGRLEEAEVSIRAGLGIARERGDTLCTYVALYNLAQVAFAKHDIGLAVESLGEGIRLSRLTRDQANLGHFLDALAAASAISGDMRRTAVLIGASEGAFKKVGASVYNFYIPDPSLKERAVTESRSALGETEYGTLLGSGAVMDFDEAADYALNE